MRALSTLVMFAASGCVVEPRTEIMVRIEGDEIIRDVTRIVEIEVYGGTRTDDIPSQRVIEIPFSIEAGLTWPITHGVIPRDNDPTRRFRIEATARNDSGEFVAHTRAISVFVRQQTRVLTLRFFAACIYNDSCVASLAEYCDESGMCRDSRRDPDPIDAGVVGIDAAGADAAGMDAAGLDAGPPRDAAPPPSDAGPPCASSAECTGGTDCMPGVCTASGCRYDPAPDGRGCTDDGVFCNGTEVCRGGVCDHTGDPCLGGTTCDLGLDTCVGCEGGDDCPMTTMWSGTCAATMGPCSRTGTEFGTVMASMCMGGMCRPVSGGMTSRSCDRGDTEGILCGPARMCPPCMAMCTMVSCFAVQCVSEMCRAVPTGETIACPCSDGGLVVFPDGSS